MTEILVNRLRITCRDGPRPARLAAQRRLQRIAATLLPDALDGALAGFAGESDRLTVALDFDLTAYDDTTVAALWADRIRRTAADGLTRPPIADAHEDAARRGRSNRVGVPDATAPRTPPPPSTVTHLAAFALSILSGARPERWPDRWLLPISDSGTAKNVLARLGSGERHRLVAIVERAEDHLRERLSTADRVGREPVGRRSQPTPVTGGSADGPGRDSAPAGVLADRLAEAALRLLHLRPDARDTPRGVDPIDTRRDVDRVSTVETRVGGLVLLYPWLTSFCERAVEMRPDLDPVVVRRSALAEVVAADPTYVLDDPLVRWLAGEPAETLTAPPMSVAPVDTTAATSGAHDVLRSFASALPGFADSSLEYLRREFIVREGRLRPRASDGDLVLARRPLDPALSRLSYPLGVLRLPWTPLLLVSWEDS